MKSASIGVFLTALGLLILAAIVVGCASTAQAQTAQAQDVFTGTPTPPALSELELALIENLNLLTELRKLQLEADTCRGQLAQPRADATAQQVTRTLDQIKARIAVSHPGWDWDPTTGKFSPKAPGKP